MLKVAQPLLVQPAISTRDEDEVHQPILLQQKDESSSTVLPEILIVDDCFFNIVAVLGILEKWNLRSDQCNNGLEAI